MKRLDAFCATDKVEINSWENLNYVETLADRLKQCLLADFQENRYDDLVIEAVCRMLKSKNFGVVDSESLFVDFFCSVLNFKNRSDVTSGDRGLLKDVVTTVRKRLGI